MRARLLCRIGRLRMVTFAGRGGVPTTAVIRGASRRARDLEGRRHARTRTHEHGPAALLVAMHRDPRHRRDLPHEPRNRAVRRRLGSGDGRCVGTARRWRPRSPPASRAAASGPPARRPQEALRIGYISGGDSDPFVLLVTEGIRAEADEGRRRAVRMRQRVRAPRRRSQLRQHALGRRQLQSMINWQFFPRVLRGGLRGLRQPADRRHRHARGAVPGDVRRGEQPRGRPGRPARAWATSRRRKFDVRVRRVHLAGHPDDRRDQRGTGGRQSQGIRGRLRPDPRRQVLHGRHVRGRPRPARELASPGHGHPDDAPGGEDHPHHLARPATRMATAALGRRGRGRPQGSGLDRRPWRRPERASTAIRERAAVGRRRRLLPGDLRCAGDAAGDLAGEGRVRARRNRSSRTCSSTGTTSASSTRRRSVGRQGSLRCRAGPRQAGRRTSMTARPSRGPPALEPGSRRRPRESSRSSRSACSSRS